MSSGVIKQGVDCWVEAKDIIDVRTGDPMDVTGFTVHAVARARWTGRRVLGQSRWNFNRGMEQVIAEWHTSPTGNQGLIIAGGVVPDRVQIHITPAQTSTWRSPLVSIQAEMTDPLTGFVERIVDELFEVSQENVRT
jgi:hypothetical protein